MNSAEGRPPTCSSFYITLTRGHAGPLSQWRLKGGAQARLLPSGFVANGHLSRISHHSRLLDEKEDLVACLTTETSPGILQLKISLKSSAKMGFFLPNEARHDINSNSIAHGSIMSTPVRATIMVICPEYHVSRGFLMRRVTLGRHHGIFLTPEEKLETFCFAVCCQQLLSRFVANDHLPRVSRTSTLS